jgi:hypothetical protein
MSAEDGAVIYYTLDGSDPDAGSLLYEGPFVADGRNVQIRGIVIKDEYFDSAIAQFSFTRKPYSYAECLDVEGETVTGGGDSQWIRVLGTDAHDGIAALRSGSIGDNEASSVEMKIEGPGNISFWWKVSSESFRTIKFDYVSFEIDGVEQSWHGGKVDWTNEIFSVEGVETHVLKWTYRKNASQSAEEDCALLDQVVWMPEAIPELNESATAEQVAMALHGTADAKLAENIWDATEYVKFRSWALGLSGVTLDEVKASPNAWLSYILDTSSLIEGDVTEARLKVTSFEQLGKHCFFSIKMRLEGVDVGNGATVGNILRIFAVEGSDKLEKTTFSVANVLVHSVCSKDGTIEFIVTPRTKGASSFFRACMHEDGNGAVIVGPWYGDKEPAPYWMQQPGVTEPGPYWMQWL